MFSKHLFLHTHSCIYKHIGIIIPAILGIWLLFDAVQHGAFVWIPNTICVFLGVRMFVAKVKTGSMCAMLNGQITRLKTDCGKLRSKITRTQSRSRSMRALIRAKCTSSSRMASELNNQTMTMNVLAQEAMQKDNEIAELAAEIETLNDTVSSLQAMLEEQQMTATRLQTVLDQCRTENNRLRSESMRCLEALGNTTALNSSLVQNNSYLGEEKTRLHEKVLKLESRIKKMQQESEQVSEENRDQHRLIMSLLPELNRKNSELGEVEDRHRRLVAKHARLQQTLRDATNNQGVLDMVAKDNEAYQAENKVAHRLAGDSIDQYSRKLQMYQMEEERIVGSIQACC